MSRIETSIHHITDLSGSRNISENTGIISMNIPPNYLIQIINGIYAIDIAKIQQELKTTVSFIYNFIPVGYVEIPPEYGNKRIKILLANTMIIPTTKTYEQVSQNLWAGVIKKGGHTNKSLGLILSSTQPTQLIPVFPRKFMIRVSKENSSHMIFSNESYGYWNINSHLFNSKRTSITKRLNSSDKESNTTSFLKDVFDKKPKAYDQKVYFTTQGEITSDMNCVNPKENMGLMTLQECNGHFDGMDMNNGDNMMYVLDNDLTSSLEHSGDKKKNTKKRTLVLKENDNPWFLNEQIVGELAKMKNAHMATGPHSSKYGPFLFYGDHDETQHPFNDPTNCSNTIAHSRADHNRKCQERDSDDDLEHFSSSSNRSNDMIIWFICMTLIILLIYRSIRYKCS